uniref:Uncharacterized protein n=1 Tax=Haemonchus contortus TaxID=6289 RepID=A0A7I4Y0P1_HAECO
MPTPWSHHPPDLPCSCQTAAAFQIKSTTNTRLMPIHFCANYRQLSSKCFKCVVRHM